MHTGFSGTVRDGEWPRPRGFGRPERLELPLDTLAHGRADPREEAARARARRPSATCSSGAHAATSRRPAEVPIAQLWGDEEVTIAGGRGDGAAAPCPAAALDRERAGLRRRRARSPRTGSTSRGSPSGCSPGRACGCAGASARYGFEVRVLRPRRGARDRRLRARLPRRARQIPSTRLRELVRAAAGAARVRRARPAPGRARAGPLRRDALCGACTSPPTSSRPSRRAGGSRSTSWSRCSSRCFAARVEGDRAGRCRPPASWSRATARCSRSS